MSIRTFRPRYPGDTPFSPGNRLRLKISQLEELASMALSDGDMVDFRRKRREASELRSQLGDWES